MSSGEIHYKYYLKGYKYAFLVSIASSFADWKFGLGYLLGYSLHRYCDNDWDLMGASSADGRSVNELPILGHYVFGISSVYGSIFRRRHRSWITHWPIISTLVRLMFLLAIPFGYLDAYGINFIGGGWVWFWVGIWLGLSQADGIHLYHDLRSTKR